MSSQIQTIESFSDFSLSPAIHQSLEAMAYVNPTPVQAKAIPLFLKGKDLIVKAQTGTGKTAAFALPILSKLTDQRLPQALILAPTRELALQVAEQFNALSKFMDRVRIAILCGGQDYRPQIKQLKDGAQIIVGTPGRIIDHLDRGTLNLSEVRFVVIDEGDEMLRMGFIDDVTKVLEKSSAERQTALFSATMPSRIRDIAKRFLKEPESIDIQATTETVSNIDQRYVIVRMAEKTSVLLRFLSYETIVAAMVFARTKVQVDEIAKAVQEFGLKAMPLHGDMSQPSRERTIELFRSGAIDILIATDVAARGLDVERVSHVFNYDAPNDAETYVHRVGRTGRAGRCGISYLFMTPSDMRRLPFIERHTKQRIQKVNIPNDSLIKEAAHRRFYASVTERLSHPAVDSYREQLAIYIEQFGIEPIDLAAALALMVNNDRSWNAELALPKVSVVRDMPVREERRGGGGSRFGRDDDNRSGSNNRRRDGGAAPTRFSDRGGFGGGRDSGRSNDRDNRDFGRSNDREGRESRGSFSRDSNNFAENLMYRLDVGKQHGAQPRNIVGAIANEANISSRDITGLKIYDDHSTVLLPKSMPKNSVKDLQKAWVCGRQLNVALVE